MPTTSEEAPAYASWIGRVFDDRYRLVRILGEGGMGAVFVAEHLRLHKEVAFKIIRPEIASDPKIAARFSREAMATAQIESPHIASAVDYGELPEGGAYLVTQLARGPSLRALLHRGGALPWPRAAEIAAQIADALATAHSLGIIHRDLKPDNIIVGERDDGAPLAIVLDFGIASLSAEATVPTANANAGEPLTSFGLVLGTPGYMAPEQAVGDRIDARTDLYALGVILWEAVAGNALWNGDSLTGIVSQQMRSPAPRLRAVAGDGIPEALDDLCDALLARAPAQRPASAGEVRNALRQLTAPDLAPLSLRPTAATALSSDARLPTLPEYGHETESMTRPGGAARRDRQVLLLLVVCFLIGGGVLISAAIGYFGDDEAATSDDDDKATPKPDERQRMSIHDDDDKPADAEADDPKADDPKADDPKADDDGSGADEFQVVKDASGQRRLIRRLRR